MKNPKVIAVDFDETICLLKPGNRTKTYKTKSVTGVPNKRIVAFINDLRAKGHKVFVYSSRWSGDYNVVSNWLKKNKIEVDDIVLSRWKADAYICDKSIFAHDIDMENKVYSLLKDNNSWGKFYEKNKTV